jgi:hypothetical protein
MSTDSPRGLITPPHPRVLGWFGTTALAMGGSNQMIFLITALFVGQGAILKIDQTFVSGLETNPQSAEIARAVIGLGKALNISVIAEGVETEGKRFFLRQEGCDGSSSVRRLQSTPTPT